MHWNFQLGHLMPQPPQLLKSSSTVMHPPPHQAWPGPQLMGVQAPAEQTWPGAQVTGGLLQDCVSVEVDPAHEPPEQE